MKTRPFTQVDVFGSVPLKGNPLAVVLDGSGLTDAQMQDFARWTNLSETTFITQPTDARADYAARIFTPGGELPFAGHPTLGSAHAWLEAGGQPQRPDVIVQECTAGLIDITRSGQELAFAAPATVRTGALDEATLAGIATALGLERSQILSHQWVDNGPGWSAVEIADPDRLLALTPDFARGTDLKLGVFAMHPEGSDIAYDIRAFVPSIGVSEDPVTGSLNLRRPVARP
ncbi:PhzF family phenazine biosynthesis protein [Rothia nasimurium]|uniref:PhzF family phenazine biosynthesis protein n=1 Tax=Rothia nasimurium TaxID=85336 RepID=UPI00214C44F9|nr:PhzF family phenazine biosynthesis protein [Rothia nasimurium]